MLWMTDLIHDAEVPSDSILHEVDEAIEELNNISPDELDLAIIKMRSNLYDNLGDLYGFGTADLLASFALFDDDPSRINTLEEEFRKITPAIVKRTVQEYLRPTNRTILIVDPKAANL
jgi:predicted Zn-dependent peptidase